VADSLTPEQRRRSMASVKGENTQPEKTVRSLLHQLGYRFRLHCRDLPGKPDIVFRSRRKVVFVHGCFWHMHRCRRGRIAPITNAEFWHVKRHGTLERDRRTRKALNSAGWESFIVWECTLKDLDLVRRKLDHFLSHETRAKDKLAGRHFYAKKQPRTDAVKAKQRI